MKYVVTASGYVVAASEFGVLDFDAEDIVEKGRLQPGRMLLVDSRPGDVSSATTRSSAKSPRPRPYAQWLEGNKIDIRALPDAPSARAYSGR